jgi:hypothetical protein
VSHSVVYVLLRNALSARSEDSLMSAVETALAPFNEALEVEPYQRDCYCVERNLDIRVDEIAFKKLGYADFNAMRDAFKERADIKTLENTKSLLLTTAGGYDKMGPDAKKSFHELNATLERYWRDEVIKPYRAAQAEALAIIPEAERKRPNADCTSCHGTGTYESTYNPKSRWDWWAIGGSWAGEIQGRNEVKTLKDAYEERSIFDNTRLVTALLEVAQRPDTQNQWLPFAVLTPDGEWHERGKMGWFGAVANKQDKGVWNEKVLELYRAHQDCLAVCVDVHI